ncbi:BspA family leucine-rich repeat surface protein [Marivirga harenae]|uniref:BspA family leucine-rich repeat surface protein n=1 Tax=Marivirga harenae TaxID=2010992 RepID=UPI0026E0F766|nr:BspA family leucine-rich repeat surface protein [Marivirga harenae]WKV12688.1 BspA family leucine-rich repeat surface protein [Marivirga harenae]
MKQFPTICCFLVIFVLLSMGAAFAQAPTITSLSPSSGPLGTSITIAGNNFNPSGPNDVFFGSIKVTANANAAGTQIIVNVPAGASSITPIIIRNNVSGLQASSLQSTTPFFSLTHSPTIPITTSSYNETRYNTFVSFPALSSGDFDNDGYADIVTGGGQTAIRLYRNNRLGGFSFSSTLPLTGTSGASTIVTADINADGNLDIAVGKTGIGELDIFLGNGDGSFVVGTSIAFVSGGSAGLALEDINNDGHLDLISNYFNELHIQIGNGTGNFTPASGSPKNLSPFFNPGELAIADFNEDGFIDIVTMGGSPGSVLVLLNNQDNTFADPLLYPAGENGFEIVVGDYNADENIDIAVLSFDSQNITTLSGDGLGGFTAFPASPIDMPGINLGLSQGDFDGDGIIDLVVGGNTTNLVPLLRGDGSGDFNSFPTFPLNVSPAQPYGILSDDFNNDGVADIAFAGNSAFHILLSPSSFRTTWVTTDGEINIPTTGAGYNYDVIWSNLTNLGVGNGAASNLTGDYTITGLSNGDTYQLLIKGDFPRINFNNGGDKDKIFTIEEWGDNQWSTMQTAFYGCTNLTVPAVDAPNLSSTLSLNQMFRGASSFNESIDHWDVSNIILFFGMFQDATSFNQPLNSWDISSATSISNMFQGATSFNQPLSNWVTTGLTDIKVMFKDATSFNQSVNNFDVSLVTDFAGTFEGATSFDQPLNNWDVSSANSLALMFYRASAFNQDLSSWDVSNATSMAYMFGFASSFDQDLGGWDIGQVTSMIDMLWLSNLSISNYDNALIGWSTISGSETQIPSGITSFRSNGLSYCNGEAARQFLIDNQGWAITLDSKSVSCPPNIISFTPTSAASGATVTITGTSFTGTTAVSFGGTAAASFSVNSDTEITAVVANGTSGSIEVTTSEGTSTLAGFTFIPPPTITSFAPTFGNEGETITITGVDFTGATAVSFGGIAATSYTVISDTEISAVIAASSSSGNIEVTTANGTALLNGFMFNPFITTWVTDNSSIIIPTTGGGYNYDVSWTNLTTAGVGDGTLTGRTGNTSIFGLTTGDVYQVRITGVFPRIYFEGSTFQNQQKIRSIEQWSNNNWTSMEGAFSSCRNMVINANDSPDLSNVTSLSSMFVGVLETNAFTNTDLTSWDVSNITDMSYLFNFAWYFNQDISSWDVSQVTNMAYMFGGAYYFNQPLNSWDVSNVINMELMFFELLEFNQPLDQWDVSNVQFMNGMFSYTEAFNQPLDNWDVSNVTNMQEMFAGSLVFNQPLNLWNVSSVTDMSLMFQSAEAFDQPLDNWNVSNVTEMWAMFQFNDIFNQNISNWNVSNVTDMWRMFQEASVFDQDLGVWDVSNVFDMDNMLSNSGLSIANYDATLIGWSSLSSLQPSISFGALSLNYCEGETARNSIIGTFGWTFNDAGKNCIPSIASFTPTLGGTGATVTITGNNLISATNVSFGGTAASSFTVVNNTTINAVLGSGSSGDLEVITPDGTATLSGFVYIPAPNITSFTPTSAASAGTVTIAGSNLNGATSVTFGGTNATTFTVVSATEITAVVASGTSGSIEITTPGGTASISNFTFIAAPTISSFSPLTAAQGETVTISGTNLTGATAVTFGGTAAASFSVNSDTEISAVVANGTSGNIEITTPGGTASIINFIFIAAPTISSFSPLTAAQGETISITGTNFTGTTEVKFGGTPTSSFSVVSATEITAVVGNGSSGNIEVTTAGGTFSVPNFIFIPAPGIDSFSPGSAGQGETVTITGTNFTGTTEVNFGGTPATSFSVVSATEITAVVANGSSGNIEVTTAGGTFSVPNFIFIPAPGIDSFSPSSAGQGETVTITGTNFTGTTEVNFGGTPATSFSVVSATEITAVVANGSSGNIEVTNVGGTFSVPNFIFIPAPGIDSFSPLTAAQGETVTISGANLTGATAVTFGGTAAASFSVNSDTEISAVVANGTSGNIEITTPGGTASIINFIFIAAPTISSFSPLTAAQGETVTITGNNFTGTTEVNFGGTPATSFSVVSATEITAVVANGSSGNIEVTTAGGTTSIPNFLFISNPTIDSFSPLSAAEGENVTITGTNFTGTSAVSFGGTAATSFTVIADNMINAVVGEGSSGAVMVTTPAGTASLEGFTLIFSQIGVIWNDNVEIENNQSEAINFGAVSVGGEIEKQIVILNTGNKNLEISNISSSAEAFTVQSTLGVVESGFQASITILFSAANVGVYESEIRINNNSRNSPEFIFTISAELTGLNIIDGETDSLVISNQDINLGSTVINVNVDKNFNIENLSSTSIIEILSIDVDNPVFRIINAPASIAPASSEVFTVRLTANSLGEYSGLVTVKTNLNDFTFRVTGTVIEELSTDIKVYNVVTPNGDGRHDFLLIDNITEYQNNNVSIFNRLGNRVFEIDNYDNSSRIFEGNSNSGEQLLTGNYYYVIDKGNGEKRISGFLIIKR